MSSKTATQLIRNPALEILEILLNGDPLLYTEAHGRAMFAPTKEDQAWPVYSAQTKAWLAHFAYEATNHEECLTTGQINTMLMVLAGIALQHPAPGPTLFPDFDKKPDLSATEEIDPVLETVVYFRRGKTDSVTYTAKKLLDELVKTAVEIGISTWQEAWPGSASHLSRRLNILAPTLASLNIYLVIGKQNGKRHIKFLSPTEFSRDGRDGNPPPPRTPPSPNYKETKALELLDGRDGKDDAFEDLMDELRISSTYPPSEPAQEATDDSEDLHGKDDDFDDLMNQISL